MHLSFDQFFGRPLGLLLQGQVLVELDASKLSDQVARSRAALSSAIARVAQAEAHPRLLLAGDE